MKLHTALLLGALITIPGIALAQDAAPAASGVPMRHQMDAATMKAHMAAMKQIEGLHKAERAAMLGDLSPSHRTYLAWVIGNLAVAAQPDPKAAIAAIDAKLTAGERSAVLATHATYAAKSKTLFASLMKNMPHPPGAINPGGPMQPAQAMTWPSGASNHPMHRRPITAGRLLFAAVGFGGHHDRMMDRGMMRHPMMRHPMMAPDGPVPPAPTPNP